MAPTIGRIVHYTISEDDARQVRHQQNLMGGAMFKCNEARAGSVLPAIVVSGPHGPDNLVNLQVFLDGDCSYWATSRAEGEGQGKWAWPPKVEANR